MAHDAYFCDAINRGRQSKVTFPFPTQRRPGDANYIGAVTNRNTRIPFIEQYQCPNQCRGNPEWKYC